MAGIALNNNDLASLVLSNISKSASVLAILKTYQLSASKLALTRHQLYQYLKLSDFFRLVVATSSGFKVSSRSGPLNKLLNPAHFVRWTAVPLHFCDFASQNYFTKMQKPVRRLARR